MEEYGYAHPVETLYYLEFMVLDFRVNYWFFEQQHDFLNLESLIQNAFQLDSLICMTSQT